MSVNYKQYYFMGEIADSIQRLPDNAFISNDPMNRDWQQYQAWLYEGNTPLPPS